MQKFLDIAWSELGYLEKSWEAYRKNPNVIYSKDEGKGSDNVTKFWDVCKSMQGAQWCNAFVNWCATQRWGTDKAKEVLCTPGAWSFYTPTSSSYFKSANRWTKTAQKGAIIYFKNSERIHHVGIVVEVANGYITTVEGNTSSNSYNNDGGCVASHRYQIGDSKIAGFGLPKYPNDSLKDGWEKNGSDWYYYKDGELLKEVWKKYNHYWYYLKPDGKMATDWLEIPNADGVGEWFYFDHNGVLWHEVPNGKGAMEKWYVE